MLKEWKAGREHQLEGTIKAISWRFITMYTEVVKHPKLDQHELSIAKSSSANTPCFNHFQCPPNLHSPI